jgi:hypothetical protein
LHLPVDDGDAGVQQPAPEERSFDLYQPGGQCHSGLGAQLASF